ncbi:hypothetical protein Tco_1125022 [Tanacetum coccineum]|uniref:Uncharacterized protein n=1 Tax=Tanacetum coccineum TaxID=301880 RepID=A0ABQ5J7S8_9ASTR
MVSIDDLSVAAVCCVEEYIESSIMKSGVSFYATTSKGTLKNLKHCTGKVQLQDTKILDNAGIWGLVSRFPLVLFGSNKEGKVLFSSLGRMLISVGSLDYDGVPLRNIASTIAVAISECILGSFFSKLVKGCRVISCGEYIESSIMKSGVSFYATTSKGTLKNLKHCTGKVQLQDTKILDNAGIGDLVFKNSLDIVWILKDASCDDEPVNVVRESMGELIGVRCGVWALEEYIGNRQVDLLEVPMVNFHDVVNVINNPLSPNELFNIVESLGTRESDMADIGKLKSRLTLRRYLALVEITDWLELVEASITSRELRKLYRTKKN